MKQKYQQGFTLLSTMIILISCAVFLLGGLWLVSSSSIQLSQTSGASEAAFYAAEGTLAQTMSLLKNNSSWPPVDLPELGDDPVAWGDEYEFNGIMIARQVVISYNDENQLTYTITISSRSGKLPRKMAATVIRQPESRNLLDIVLTLDVSGSMGHQSPTNFRSGYDCCRDPGKPNPLVRGNKGYCCLPTITIYEESSCTLADSRLNCAKEASVSLLETDIFSSDYDSFGLVSYGSRAEVYQVLTNDFKDEGSSLRLSLTKAVEDAKTLVHSLLRGTNIGDALKVSNESLLLYGREDALKIIILLTDGQPTVAPSKITDFPKTVNPPYKYINQKCSSSAAFSKVQPCEPILKAKSGFLIDELLSGCAEYIRENGGGDSDCVTLNTNTDGAVSSICYCVAGKYAADFADSIKAPASSPIIYVIGLGKDVNGELLKEIASSPEHYFFVSNASQLSQAFADIASHIENMFSYSLMEVVPD
ncbi:hypothetical protein COT52_01175 [candidate division WWE3 bacterium CG08_land_8_20_14_0_20_43_13]|uniref:VWFA domain-containing protein n=1 Tax=candidate division WWE3 bacterium CG08_land_8_20_14_0_20_43_13 TaxID=1975087 RepID=A0A2H0X7P9_UNCKA|nr:MAG: hypothetical protein COT52_01175 [candidate division WWE3 bacterium CG08_land_8_20_14_0_20_43_13]